MDSAAAGAGEALVFRPRLAGEGETAFNLAGVAVGSTAAAAGAGDFAGDRLLLREAARFFDDFGVAVTGVEGAAAAAAADSDFESFALAGVEETELCLESPFVAAAAGGAAAVVVVGGSASTFFFQ